jgi:hypothetical protein
MYHITVVIGNKTFLLLSDRMANHTRAELEELEVLLFHCNLEKLC